MSEISELLERYRRGTDVTEEALSGVSAGELDFRPEAGKWSIRQVVNHLADTEAVAVCWFRAIIADDNAKLLPFNQDLWASRTDSETRDPERALRTMRVLRDDNYELLKSLPETAFSRVGTHLQHGEMALQRLVEILAGHPEKHATQIKNNKAAHQSAQAK